MDQLSEQLKAFFDQYGKATENSDIKTTVNFYGFPCFMISDDFVGALSAPEELAQGLTQAHEFYKQFNLAKITYGFTKIEEVSEKLIRVRITWNFYDSKDKLLVETDNVYLLRKENNSFKIYVVIPFNEQQKMQELVQRKQGTGPQS